MTSHLQYSRGSIIYASFEDEASNFAFLNRRPLLVVSNPLYIFGCVSVIPITSQDRPGIRIAIRHSDGSKRDSIIQPWSVITIPRGSVIKASGIIDPLSLKAVDQAMAFHLGMSDKVPPYLEPFAELYKPSYSMVGLDNVSNDFSFRVKKYTNDEFISPEVNSETTDDEYAIKEVETEDSDHPEINSETTDDEYAIKEVETGTKLVISVTNALSHEDQLSILARTMTGNDFALKTGLASNKMKDVRSILMHRFGDAGIINNILKKDAKRFSELSEFQKVIVSSSIPLDSIDVKNKNLFVRYINNTRKKYNIDKTNRRKWKGLAESERLMNTIMDYNS